MIVIIMAVHPRFCARKDAGPVETLQAARFKPRRG